MKRYKVGNYVKIKSLKDIMQYYEDNKDENGFVNTINKEYIDRVYRRYCNLTVQISEVHENYGINL